MSYSDDQVCSLPLLYDELAERGILGLVLVHNDMLDLLDIEPEDFYLERHKEIYRSFLRCRASGVASDLIAVTDDLERRNVLEMVGGAAYLARCISDSAPLYAYDGSVRIVRDYAHRRRTLDIASKLAKDAYDRARELNIGISEALDALVNFGINLQGGGSHPMAGVASDVYDMVVERAKNPKRAWGMTCGLPDIDNYVGGFMPGDMMLLSGEPGIGKSKLALQIVLGMAHERNGRHGGVIYSMEMSEVAITIRALSALGEIQTRRMKSGIMDDDAWQRLNQALAMMEEMDVYIWDKPLSLAELRADLAKRKALNGVEWAMVDYLVLMTGYEDLKEHDASARLSRGIKQIARDLGVFILVIESTTKEAFDGGRVGKSVVRGSGQVIHDADLVAILTEHADVVKNENMVTLHFAKTRDVEVGPRKFHLYAHRDYPLFSCVAPMTR